MADLSSGDANDDFQCPAFARGGSGVGRRREKIRSQQIRDRARRDLGSPEEHGRRREAMGTLQDDWSDYGSAVQDASEDLVGVQVAKLDTGRNAFKALTVHVWNLSWAQSIVPAPQLFRSKVC